MDFCWRLHLHLRTAVTSAASIGIRWISVLTSHEQLEAVASNLATSVRSAREAHSKLCAWRRTFRSAWMVCKEVRSLYLQLSTDVTYKFDKVVEITLLSHVAIPFTASMFFDTCVNGQYLLENAYIGYCTPMRSLNEAVASIGFS